MLLNDLLTVPEDAAQAEKNLDAVMSHYVRTPRLAELVQHAALTGGTQVDLLVKRWYGPLFARATQLSGGAPVVRGKRKRAAPGNAFALDVAFHSMPSGYLTMASLHQRLVRRDPRDPRALAQFSDLLRTLARGLWSASV